MCLKCILCHFRQCFFSIFFLNFFRGTHPKKFKKIWSKMAWNGLKCILNNFIFYFFLFFFSSVKNDPVRTPPPSVEFSTFFLTGSLKIAACRRHYKNERSTKHLQRLVSSPVSCRTLSETGPRAPRRRWWWWRCWWRRGWQLTISTTNIHQEATTTRLTAI